MRGCTRRSGLAVAFLLITSTLTVAQLKPNGVDQAADVRQLVDEIMQPFLAQNTIPGAIVGVSLHGKRYFFAYGKATGAGDPFTPDTLIEIGSCTKVFTTTIFALAVNRGQIAARQSVQKYMPRGFTLQSRARAVTALELANFTSGMPDDPTNLPPGPLWKRNIENYTTAEFLKWVTHWNPNSKLPAPYKYSNAGIGLLSYLVANAAGKGWEDQLNAEIVRPLSLQDTTLRPNPAQKKRMAQGHRSNGNNAPLWPIFAWYAAGGLRSTARDMLRFGEANLGHEEVDGHPVSDGLTAAMQLAQKPIYTLPNGRNQQGMAWVTNVGPPGTYPVLLKNGGTVGFSSVIVLNPNKDLTLFIAMNQQGSNPAELGVEMARRLP